MADKKEIAKYTSYIRCGKVIEDGKRAISQMHITLLFICHIKYCNLVLLSWCNIGWIMKITMQPVGSVIQRVDKQKRRKKLYVRRMKKIWRFVVSIYGSSNEHGFSNTKKVIFKIKTAIQILFILPIFCYYFAGFWILSDLSKIYFP